MGQIYLVENWVGGISSWEDRGPKGSYRFASNNNPRTGTDSLICQQALTDEGLDSAQSPSASPSPSSSKSSSPSPSASSSPSPTPSPSASPSPSSSASASPSVTPSSSISASPSPSAGLTTVFEDLIHTFVKGSDGYTYGLGNAGNIYRRDASAFWQRVYKAPSGAIKGGAEWTLDTKKRYLYFATNVTLYRKHLDGLANWNDVETVGELNSATWHTMREAGGALVIANGNWMAQVGYDGSYTNEALNLIPGNTANTLVERNGRAIIGTTRTGEATKGINAAIDTEYPFAQVGDDGEIYFSDMVNTIPSKRFPGGGKVNPGGVANQVDQANIFEWEQDSLSWISKKAVGNMAMFAVFSATAGKGGIYTYGRKHKEAPFILNLDYQLTADELGALIHIAGTTLVSYKDGSDYGVKAVDSTTKATCTWEGLDLHSKADGISKIVPWNMAEVELISFPANCKCQFWYKRNRTGSFIQAQTSNGSDEALSGTKIYFNLGCEAEILQPRIVLIPSGNNSPEVSRLLLHIGSE